MNKKSPPKILVVTNRRLCQENFFNRIEKLAKTAIDGIILREKDLSESQYEALAKEVLTICRRYGKECILHSFPDVALRLEATKIHLPLRKAAECMNLDCFKKVGISIHSVEEAKEAQALGATYVTAGHIFATDCKQCLSPRGLSFVKAVRAVAPIPVFAIGGINENNLVAVLGAGADGACFMSSMMTCVDPQKYVDRLYSAVKYFSQNKLSAKEF
jgi:thiamine-phosphate diphosphorylase